MPSLLDALQTLGPVNLRRVADDSHSIAKQASFETQFFSCFGRFWKVLGGPEGGKNWILNCFFFNIFFKCVLASLFHCFFEGRTLDFLDFSAHTQCFMRFLLNRRFWTRIKKSLDFRSLLGGQNDEKSIKNRVRNNVFFQDQILIVF